MRYKALVSFTGIISMAMGDVREISDTSVAKDLLNAGYVEEIKEISPEKVTEEKTSPKRKEKKDDN